MKAHKITKEKCFSKTSFQLWMDLKKVQQSMCGLTIRATSQLLPEKPKKCLNENVKHVKESFEAITHQS